MRKYGKQIQLNLDCIFVKIDNKWKQKAYPLGF